ncbi:MAG: SpoIIE family protein phosphatase [Usitatibacter sp.]
MVSEPSVRPRFDELTIDANGAEIRRASEWVCAACHRREVPLALADRLVLCLNEVLANVVTHGGPTARAAPIRVLLEVGREEDCGNASLTVSDTGRAFDPTSAAHEPLPRTLDEASPGGRGMLIIRRCSDWVRYRNEGGQNHLTFGARWTVQPAATTQFPRSPDRRVANLPHPHEQRQGTRRGEAFQWITLFRDADPRELEEALADCEVMLLGAGAPLLRAGEANRSVFILLSGRLVAQLGEDTNADTVIVIAPGECIGELSAIDGKPISALVHAVTDVRVLRLDREVFWNRLMLLRGVAANMMATLTERMRRSNQTALALQRERLEFHHLKKELEVARQLQASMLPLQRPLFPGRSDIEVCGFMEPASRVGGDLFDAFFVDSRTLFVCIGDVSGHGIAAALFMVRVIGLLRALAMDTTQPDEILQTLNDRLCIGNDANLFVTLFCGFLDVQDGRFVYSNGGHCVPMVCSDRGARRLPLPKGMLVGAASGRRYSSLECELAVGEILFCYSDGLTEAQDPAGMQLSEEGCIEWLCRGDASELPALLDSLFERVVQHTGSKLMSDDCTMLAVRRLVPGS